MYLYKKDYDKAAQYAKEVMDQVPLTPQADYVNMFRKAQAFPGEGILRMNTYDTGAGMRNLCSPLSSQTCTVEPSFLASFNQGDVRTELFTYVGEAEDGEEYEGKV